MAPPGNGEAEAPTPGSREWWDSRLRPARRDLLSVEKITASAIEILDREGLDGLTMRRIAARLGVAAPSLYRYVESREALLVEVLESVLTEIDLHAPAGTWREQSRWLAHSARDTMLSHPGVAALLGTVPMLGPNANAIFDAGLRVCEEGGIPRDLAIAACQAIVFLVRSFVVYELVELERLSFAPGTLVDPEQCHGETARRYGLRQPTAADELFEFFLSSTLREIDALVTSRNGLSNPA